MMADSKGVKKLKDCFYVPAKSLEKAMSLVERHGPDAWFGERKSAEYGALPGEKIYKVTVSVEEA